MKSFLLKGTSINMFIYILQKFWKKQNYQMHNKSKFNQIDRFVRRKIDHSQSEELFNKQLKQQIQLQISRFQQNQSKTKRSKHVIQERSRNQLRKREEIQRQLKAKMYRSEERRKKELSSKTTSKVKERIYRQGLYQERVSLLKKKQAEKSKILMKKILSERSLTPVIDNQEHISNTEYDDHYQKKIARYQEEYNRLKRNAEGKKIFQKPRYKLQILKVSETQPRKKDTTEQEKRSLDNLVQHLNHIEKARKKKEKLLHEQSKKCRSANKFYKVQQSQNLLKVRRQELEKKKKVMQRVQKEIKSPPKKEPLQSYSSHFMESEEDFVLESEIHERPTFRSQIKHQIKEYMLRYKQRELIK